MQNWRKKNGPTDQNKLEKNGTKFTHVKNNMRVTHITNDRHIKAYQIPIIHTHTIVDAQQIISNHIHSTKLLFRRAFYSEEWHISIGITNRYTTTNYLFTIRAIKTIEYLSIYKSMFCNWINNASLHTPQYFTTILRLLQVFHSLIPQGRICQGHRELSRDTPRWKKWEVKQ